MKTVVILQPQFFPWLGVFEQIACCDTFVHFDHVQLPQGRSFCSRVQIKTAQGVQWLSAPILRQHGQTILETRTNDSVDWRRKHLATLRAAWKGYPYRDMALDLIEGVYRDGGSSLAELNILAVERLAKALGLRRTFKRSSQIENSGSSHELLLSILHTEDATRYVSGMGGLSYIDHDQFEQAGVTTEYLDYARAPYPQAHGDFTPYVSTLDAIAACGPDAASLISGRTTAWRDALAWNTPRA